jgi:hypothetical protein
MKLAEIGEKRLDIPPGVADVCNDWGKSAGYKET